MIPIDETLPEDARDDDDEEFFDMDPIDDDGDLEDFDVDTDEEVDGPSIVQDRVPVWRLIEMTREDRDLKCSTADFADYDVFGDIDGGLAGEASH